MSAFLLLLLEGRVTAKAGRVCTDMSLSDLFCRFLLKLTNSASFPSFFLVELLAGHRSQDVFKGNIRVVQKSGLIGTQF